jgi:ubiquinone/menaquinone biosynthesis C-methylase UbiE
METKQHLCPVWVGYLMASPLRKLQQNPQKILNPYITTGMNILELGPAMGYFSLPMAKMTGENGKVYCIDIQENMLKKLKNRAKRKGVNGNIETRLASQDSINIGDLKEKIDFTLLAYVVHEVSDRKKLFTELYEAMKKNAKILFLEPKMHVKETEWMNSLRIANESGFALKKQLVVSGSRGFELMKM